MHVHVCSACWLARREPKGLRFDYNWRTQEEEFSPLFYKNTVQGKMINTDVDISNKQYRLNTNIIPVDYVWHKLSVIILYLDCSFWKEFSYQKWTFWILDVELGSCITVVMPGMNHYTGLYLIQTCFIDWFISVCVSWLSPLDVCMH